MRKILFNEPDEETIRFEDLDPKEPIFIKNYGALRGMIIWEESGWIAVIGCKARLAGYYDTIEKCIEECIKIGYELFTNSKD